VISKKHSVNFLLIFSTEKQPNLVKPLALIQKVLIIRIREKYLSRDPVPLNFLDPKYRIYLRIRGSAQEFSASCCELVRVRGSNHFDCWKQNLFKKNFKERAAFLTNFCEKATTPQLMRYNLGFTYGQIKRPSRNGWENNSLSSTHFKRRFLL
jgi:hypothetical protein